MTNIYTENKKKKKILIDNHSHGRERFLNVPKLMNIRVGQFFFFFFYFVNPSLCTIIFGIDYSYIVVLMSLFLFKKPFCKFFFFFIDSISIFFSRIFHSGYGLDLWKRGWFHHKASSNIDNLA